MNLGQAHKPKLVTLGIKQAFGEDSHSENVNSELTRTKMAVGKELSLPHGTNVCFDGFLWFSPSTCLPICLRPEWRGGKLANILEGKWNVSFCLVAPIRGRPRDTVEIVVFVGGPLLENCAVFCLE